MKTLLLTTLFAASVAGATDFDTSVTHIQPQPGNKNPATAGRKVDRAYAYGFSLALNDPHLITTPAFGSADTVYLDSMTLLNRSFHKEKKKNASMKVAIYTQNNQFVALSNESTDSLSPNKDNTLTFNGAPLKVKETYKYLFVDSGASPSTLKSQSGRLPETLRIGIELYCVPQANAVYYAEKLNKDLTADSSSLYKRFNGFMPVVTFRTTDQQPSEFTLHSPAALLLMGGGVVALFLWSAALIAHFRRKN